MNSMIPTPSLNNCFLCDVTGIRSGICQGTFPKGCFLFLGIYIIWVPCIKWNFLPENSTAIGLFLFISLASHVTASFLTHGFWELGGILVIVRLTPLSHRWGHCSLPRFCSEVDKGTGLELSLPQCMHVLSTASWPHYTWVHILDVLTCPPTHVLCTSAWRPLSTRENSREDWETKDTFLRISATSLGT